MAIGGGLMFVYYSTVYSTIQDVIEPSLRGTAMALYFFAMYLFGGSFGPVITGFLSESSTRTAAIAAGVTDLTRTALEPFRATGLHNAMYLVPALGCASGDRALRRLVHGPQGYGQTRALDEGAAARLAA